jgi:thioredoxin 1
MLTPIINEVKSELNGVSFQYVDVDENGDLASKYGVRGVPTVVIEKNGVEVKRFVGMQQKGTLVNAINSYL